MALKDLLVHVDHSEAGMARMRLAADLAARHAAQLTVLHVRERSLAQSHRLKAAELGMFPAAASGALDRAIEHELDQDALLLRTLLNQLRGELTLDAEWRSVTGRTGHLVTQLSRTADLTIVGHDVADATDLPDGYSFAETMLFTSGRPLLIVPPVSASATLGRQIALAWNGSRPAARALADALALIGRAERTFVLTVDPERLGRGEPFSEKAILAHLGRHTDNVQHCVLQARGQAIADLLQSEALAQGADLLVAGAYGQPKLWEKMLGGTTRDLLARMRMPVLMSH